jgi:hypothetical protein
VGSRWWPRRVPRGRPCRRGETGRAGGATVGCRTSAGRPSVKQAQPGIERA